MLRYIWPSCCLERLSQGFVFTYPNYERNIIASLSVTNEKIWLRWPQERLESNIGEGTYGKVGPGMDLWMGGGSSVCWRFLEIDVMYDNDAKPLDFVMH